MSEDRVERKMLRWAVIGACSGVAGALLAALALAWTIAHDLSQDAVGTVAPSNDVPATGTVDSLETESGAWNGGLEGHETPSGDVLDVDPSEALSTDSVQTERNNDPGTVGGDTEASNSVIDQDTVIEDIASWVWRSDLGFWAAIWHTTLVMVATSTIFALIMVVLVASYTVNAMEAMYASVISFAAIGVGHVVVPIRAMIDDSPWLAMVAGLASLIEALILGVFATVGLLTLADHNNPLLKVSRLLPSVKGDIPLWQDEVVFRTLGERQRNRINAIKEQTESDRMQLREDLSRFRAALYAVPGHLRRQRIFAEEWSELSQIDQELRKAIDVAEDEIHADRS